MQSGGKEKETFLCFKTKAVVEIEVLPLPEDAYSLFLYFFLNKDKRGVKAQKIFVSVSGRGKN